MSVLITATGILSVLVVVLTLYIVKKKCLPYRQTPTRHDSLSEVKQSKYEVLQQRKAGDGVDRNTAAEYMEISAISSEYINLN